MFTYEKQTHTRDMSMTHYVTADTAFPTKNDTTRQDTFKDLYSFLIIDITINRLI